MVQNWYSASSALANEKWCFQIWDSVPQVQDINFWFLRMLISTVYILTPFLESGLKIEILLFQVQYMSIELFEDDFYTYLVSSASWNFFARKGVESWNQRLQKHFSWHIVLENSKLKFLPTPTNEQIQKLIEKSRGVEISRYWATSKDFSRILFSSQHYYLNIRDEKFFKKLTLALTIRLNTTWCLHSSARTITQSTNDAVSNARESTTKDY